MPHRVKKHIDGYHHVDLLLSDLFSAQITKRYVESVFSADFPQLFHLRINA